MNQPDDKSGPTMVELWQLVDRVQGLAADIRWLTVLMACTFVCVIVFGALSLVHD